jgi:hypothetical protein
VRQPGLNARQAENVVPLSLEPQDRRQSANFRGSN